MSEASIHPHAVMEGGGAYNRYAKPQAQGIGSALPLFARRQSTWTGADQVSRHAIRPS